jgi:hypothetical protein
VGVLGAEVEAVGHARVRGRSEPLAAVLDLRVGRFVGAVDADEAAERLEAGDVEAVDILSGRNRLARGVATVEVEDRVALTPLELGAARADVDDLAVHRRQEHRPADAARPFVLLLVDEGRGQRDRRVLAGPPLRAVAERDRRANGVAVVRVVVCQVAVAGLVHGGRGIPAEGEEAGDEEGGECLARVHVCLFFDSFSSSACGLGSLGRLLVGAARDAFHAETPIHGLREQVGHLGTATARGLGRRACGVVFVGGVHASSTSPSAGSVP